jgi:hypothetical protein
MSYIVPAPAVPPERNWRWLISDPYCDADAHAACAFASPVTVGEPNCNVTVPVLSEPGTVKPVSRN